MKNANFDFSFFENTYQSDNHYREFNQNGSDQYTEQIL